MRGSALVLIAIVGCAAPESASVEQASTQCATDKVEGVDVYGGTGTIDWAMVKASGRGFAFIKATQGDYNKQTTFASNWSNSAANGIMRSAYHFFDPTVDGTTQAQWFLAAVAAAGGMTSSDLPPMLDIECPVAASQSTAESQGPNCENPGNSGWVATATLKQRIFDWLDAVEAATGRKAIIYSYASWFASVQLTDPALTAYPLFIASYNSCATIPAPFQTAIFWQYSATGSVPGITGNADVDRFFGSAGDLGTWNASTVPGDAGVNPPDADTLNPDGGTNGNSGGGGGCGCGVEGFQPSGLVLAIAIVACGLRRTRRRRA